MSVPPAVALGAFYEGMLQSALQQFFRRASLEIEPGKPAAWSERPPRIEPIIDPSVLRISSAGTAFTLRMPGRSTFTSHQIRMARAVIAVIAARYRAIVTPELAAERGELFRGPIEDRYVGAFFDERPYSTTAAGAIDRIASIIEIFRVAALSSYENRPISTGILLLGGDYDPVRPQVGAGEEHPTSYVQGLTRIKSFYRLADGVRTVFLSDAEGRMLDIIDIDRWSRQLCPDTILEVPGANAYQGHARATLEQRSVCVVLSPSRDIKVFAEGAEVFSFHGAAWHLLDLKAKYEIWADALGNPALALGLFQAALDLADAREGALFAVLRDPDEAVPQLVAPADRLDRPLRMDLPGSGTVSRREILHLLQGRTVTDLDPSVLSTLASLDGAVVVDRGGRLIAAGAILRHPASEDLEDGGIVEGARTTAAMAASRFGPVLKVSEDGEITFYDRERIWDI